MSPPAAAARTPPPATPARPGAIGLCDHRGKPCGSIPELRGPPHFFPLLRPGTPLGRALAVRLNVAFALWCAGIVLLIVLLAWPMPWLSSVLGRMPRWLFAACLLALAASMLGFVVVRSMARAHWNATGRAAAATLTAARGRCPACGTWLLSVMPDADGLTACPSCAAAWRVGNAQGCPGCGYDMGSVPATAGPLAICPECATLSVASRPGDSMA